MRAATAIDSGPDARRTTTTRRPTTTRRTTTTRRPTTTRRTTTTRRPTTTVAPSTTTTVAPSTTTTLPHHPAAFFRLTAGSPRSTEFLMGPPGPEDHHGNRIYCVVSHFSYDDPIVYPGQPEAAHAHMFWGNTTTNHATTGVDLQTTGNSSCEGGINNRSAYWVPVLFNSDHEAVLPDQLNTYYKTFGGPGFDRSTLRPIPSGLEMLASLDVPNAGPWNFRRDGSDTVNLQVQFPTCLQVTESGQPVLSSADNVSHTAYATGAGSNGCPASHPYRIPGLIYALSYDVPFASDWYLSSDTPGEAKGASLHADYVAAWDEETMRRLVNCNIEIRSCDFAGDRGQLAERFLSPDGQVIYPLTDRTPFGTAIKRHAHHGHIAGHGAGHSSHGAGHG